MSKAAKAFSVGGVGAQPTLDDVARVAGGLAIALDHAGSERIKKESPAPKNFAAEAYQPSPAQQGAALTAEQARAVIIVKLLAIMNGKSGARLQLAEYLAGLLNNGITPALPAAAEDDAVLGALADACQPEGAAAIAAQLEAAGLSAPAVSSAERVVLQSGASASAGVGVLAVQAGKTLLSIATAVAALSCEAFGVQVKPFEADVVEAQPYKASIAAADELRSLLEGSKQVATRKGASAEDAAAFAQLPATLGAVQEGLAAAYSAVRPEVQSAALAPKGSASPNTCAPQLASTLLEAGRCLLSLAVQSSGRAARVGAALAQQMAGPSASVQQQIDSARQQLQAVGEVMLRDVTAVPGVAAALAATSALAVAQRAVALEALAAVAALRVQEGPAAVEAAAAALAAATVADGADGADGAKKGKDKKKDKRGGGMLLGKGTAIVRAFVEATAAAAADGAGGSFMPVAADGSGLAVELGAAFDAVASALAPQGAAVASLLSDVRVVVEANQARRKPKVAKGARDFLPEQMSIREQAFAKISAVFKRHGAVSIDTPVFELKETLTGKYGEDSKLIYELADQGGELLALRYDLTVPFARYVAVNNIGNIKRFHIGKVYRRDQPQMNRGRFREFFQCDFDVAGAYAPMVADAEVLKVLTEILGDLGLGEFTVKLNHRRLLDAMLAIAGVPPQKFRTICSAIDKLDKEPWEAVRSEMVDDKGLAPDVADRIGQFVVLRGEPQALLAQLSAAGHPLAEHPDSKAALDELALLFEYLGAMDALGSISFDLSLARGLDYYTGVIYEAVLSGASVGSIAAGGRYDKLVGMFSGKDVPAVGVSIGIERVFAIMEAQMKARAEASGRMIRATETEVLVASIGNGLQAKRMALASQLWAAGIKAEFGFKPNPKMGDQLGAALEQGIPFMVLFGEDELAHGVVKVKDMAAKEEAAVSTAELVAVLQAKIAEWRARQQ